jgi:hypothetical protein
LQARLLAIELGQGPAGQLEVRPHRQGLLIVLPRQFGLTGGRQEIAQVRVPDRVALGTAQEGEGLLGSTGRGQDQAQVGADPRIGRGQFQGCLERGFPRAGK